MRQLKYITITPFILQIMWALLKYFPIFTKIFSGLTGQGDGGEWGDHPGQVRGGPGGGVRRASNSSGQSLSQSFSGIEASPMP